MKKFILTFIISLISLTFFAKEVNDESAQFIATKDCPALNIYKGEVWTITLKSTREIHFRSLFREFTAEMTHGMGGSRGDYRFAQFKIDELGIKSISIYYKVKYPYVPYEYSIDGCVFELAE